MPYNPLPCSLRSEAKKASKILRDFFIPNASSGIDRIIPGTVIKNAKGLAILTVVKAGFLLSARAGSGIVVARLESGGWSAPSAIGIAGVGGGLEIGAEVTDFVIILNTRDAVQAFSKGGNFTLGGNLTLAAGPFGRNMEGDVAFRQAAVMYTYSKTKGLFVGLSIEGSAIIERKEANRKFYGEDVRACSILSGEISPPDECRNLYEVLEKHDEMAERAAVAAAATLDAGRRSKSSDSHVEKETVLGKKRLSADATATFKPEVPETHSKVGQISVFSSTPGFMISRIPAAPRSQVVASSTMKLNDSRMQQQGLREASLTVTVRHPFRAQMDCDLDMQTGDIIQVKTRTSSSFDWWEGELRGRVGLFPANYTTAA